MIAFERSEGAGSVLVIKIDYFDKDEYEILFKTLINLAGQQETDFITKDSNYYIHRLLESMVPTDAQLKS